MSEGTKNHSKELTDAQLTILDDFAYLKFSEKFKGQSVGKVVDYMLVKGGLEHNRDLNKIGKIGEYPGGKTKDDWIRTLNIMKKDPTLMSLKIVEYKHDKAHTEDKTKNGTGARMLVFSQDVNDKQNATVIFRGTATDSEWEDNGRIGYETVTNGHRETLEYINFLVGQGYTDMTTSGHSKGGNRAH